MCIRDSYNIEPILEVFDECLKPIFTKNFWGYSLPFYLSSIHNCHPNYANYFAEKNTLSVKSMHELLSMVSEDDKVSFSTDKALSLIHIFGYGLKAQILDLIPATVLSTIMFASMKLVELVSLPMILLLVLQLLVGVLVYLLVSYIFKIDTFLYLIEQMKGFLHNGEEERTHEE